MPPPTGYEASHPNRALTLAAVVALHLGLLAILAETGTLPRLRPSMFVANVIQPQRPPPPPLPKLRPDISAPLNAVIPVPEIRIAAPPPEQPAAIRAITRAAPTAHPASHFGAATDSGLGLDVGAAPGGGAGARGTLAGFESAVRRQVLSNKRQPSLAWDRRNTCVVNYRVTVTRSGALAGLSIDPCAVPEINEAARQAIRAAAPFPPPPDTAGAAAEVSGSLIFHP